MTSKEGVVALALVSGKVAKSAGWHRYGSTAYYRWNYTMAIKPIGDVHGFVCVSNRPSFPIRSTPWRADAAQAPHVEDATSSRKRVKGGMPVAVPTVSIADGLR